MQYPNHQPPGGPGIPSFPPPPPPPPSHPPLPPGWEQAIDPTSGRSYYANRSTGETSWTPPPYFLPPPPPVLQPLPPQEQQQNHYFQHPHIEQPQHMMHTSALPAVTQPIVQPVAQNLPGNDAPMPFNYSQQYAPNQLQVMEQTPSHIQPLPPDPHIPAQLRLELRTATNPSSGLGPSTATSPGMLVPSVRCMINEEYTRNATIQHSTVPKLELQGLSAGSIADLCNVTKELKSRNVDGGDFAGDGSSGKQGGEDESDQYYASLQPFSLPVSSLPPHIEPGRVDIRLHALQSKLGKI